MRIHWAICWFSYGRFNYLIKQISKSFSLRIESFLVFIHIIVIFLSSRFTLSVSMLKIEILNVCQTGFVFLPNLFNYILKLQSSHSSSSLVDWMRLCLIFSCFATLMVIQIAYGLVELILLVSFWKDLDWMIVATSLLLSLIIVLCVFSWY